MKANLKRYRWNPPICTYLCFSFDKHCTALLLVQFCIMWFSIQTKNVHFSLFWGSVWLKARSSFGIGFGVKIISSITEIFFQSFFKNFLIYPTSWGIFFVSLKINPDLQKNVKLLVSLVLLVFLWWKIYPILKPK